MRYEAMEPSGELRADYRAFVLADSVLKGLGGKPFSMADFTPNCDAKPKKQSVRGMQAVLMQAVGNRVGYAKAQDNDN